MFEHFIGTKPVEPKLAFDVASAIPAGSTITSAQLILQVTQSMSGTQTMTVHRLQADWGEGTSNALGNEGVGAAATSGDATFLFRFFNTQMWTTPGGDFVAQASASQQFNLGTATWGSTPQLVADVQGWLDAPQTNFGWLVRGDETDTMTTKRFASRENATVSSHPQLVIGFEPPGGEATATSTSPPAPTPTATPSATAQPPTATASGTPTSSGTSTRTGTSVPTATATTVPASATATATTMQTPAPTSTDSPPPTASETPTVSPQATDTVAATFTATASPTTTNASSPTTTPEATPTYTPTAVSCAGDCDGDGAVTISELILGVNIALGSQPVSACSAFDPTGNGTVEINELIAAVNNALNEC